MSSIPTKSAWIVIDELYYDRLSIDKLRGLEVELESSQKDGEGDLEATPR